MRLRETHGLTKLCILPLATHVLAYLLPLSVGYYIELLLQVEFGVQNKGVDALSRTMREDKCNSLPSRFEV